VRTPGAYARGRRRYLESEPLAACAGETERIGWLDARDRLREDALEQDLEQDDHDRDYEDLV
jgi:hypothetical protein